MYKRNPKSSSSGSVGRTHLRLCWLRCQKKKLGRKKKGNFFVLFQFKYLIVFLLCNQAHKKKREKRQRHGTNVAYVWYKAMTLAHFHYYSLALQYVGLSCCIVSFLSFFLPFCLLSHPPLTDRHYNVSLT